MELHAPSVMISWLVSFEVSAENEKKKCVTKISEKQTNMPVRSARAGHDPRFVHFFQ